MRREYGVRLRDLFTGGLTYRELSNLVRGLSQRSATRTAINSGRVEPSQEAVVLADVFDAISVLDYHLVSANSEEKKAKLLKPPKPYPRWWLQPEPDRAEQRVARLEDARRRKREREQAIAQGLIS